MKISLFCIGAVSVFCLLAVNGQDFSIVSTTSSQVSLAQDAEYSCEFINLWSSTRHPNEYPSNAHWSPPVMATHNSGYQMWAPGELATTGVETVAETGAPPNLVNEIESSGDTGNFVIGTVMFNSNDQQQTLSSLIVDSALPLISSITMIAPTPDWFSGFYDFDPRDPSTNTWFGEFTIDTYPWDAGTETGDSYSTSNDDEPENVPILRLDEETVPQSTGVFLNQDGTTVLPVAKWSCTLLTEPEESEPPSISPSESPSLSPSVAATAPPSLAPSVAPSQLPSLSPSLRPTSTSPGSESKTPTYFPSRPPSTSPSESLAPSTGNTPETNLEVFDLIASAPSDIDSSQPVEYTCTFSNLWTEERHPDLYPNQAHWSPMVVVAHSNAYTMWNDAALASEGVEDVAETGSTGKLLNEIAAAGDATGPPVTGSLMFTDKDDEQTLQKLGVDPDHPFVSAVTMIAPSPDYFSGFYNFDARDPDTGTTWLQRFVIETYPWDAGTRNDSFQNENPHIPIFQYTIDTIPSNGKFASPDETTVLPVASWECELSGEVDDATSAGVPTIMPTLSSAFLFLAVAFLI